MCVFSCFEASDYITNLHIALDRFKEEIADINGMSWRGVIAIDVHEYTQNLYRGYTMRPFICGDYEFLSGIYGLSGASGMMIQIITHVQLICMLL